MLAVALMIGLAACSNNSDLFTATRRNIGFSQEDSVPGWIITSDKFWVDRAEVGEILEKHGAKIRYMDWSRVLVTDIDPDNFPKEIARELNSFGRKNPK